MNDLTATDAYLAKYRGFLAGVLRWDDLDALWQRMKQPQSSPWYVYAVGETPPQQALSETQLHGFIDEVDRLLRREHDEDYCGIVYVDNAEQPGFIKIYDPNNLGVVCGYSDNPPLPGWVLSQLAPIDLQVAFPPPQNRRKWWRRLFG